MDHSHREIISDLKFLGKIERNQKVNVKFMTIIPDNFLSRIIRMFINQDNRLNTLHLIQRTIAGAFDIIEEYHKSGNESNKVILKHIIRDLNASKIGLGNLRYTYSSDIKFCCDIDTQIQLIDAKLGNLGFSVEDPINKIDNINDEDTKITEKIVNEKRNDKQTKK